MKNFSKLINMLLYHIFKLSPSKTSSALSSWEKSNADESSVTIFDDLNLVHFFFRRNDREIDPRDISMFRRHCSSFELSYHHFDQRRNMKKSNWARLCVESSQFVPDARRLKVKTGARTLNGTWFQKFHYKTSFSEKFWDVVVCLWGALSK